MTPRQFGLIDRVLTGFMGAVAWAGATGGVFLAGSFPDGPLAWTFTTLAALNLPAAVLHTRDAVLGD